MPFWYPRKSTRVLNKDFESSKGNINKGKFEMEMIMSENLKGDLYNKSIGFELIK